MFIDTHAHLADTKYKNINKIVNSFVANKINKVISIGCTHKEIKKSIELARKYPKLIYSTVGVYPLYNVEENEGLNEEELLAEVETLASMKEVIAIGECGIDLTEPPPWEVKRAPEDQKRIFSRQICIAKDRKKPVIVHSRKAVDETLSVIEHENYSDFVWHCFTEDSEVAKRVIEIGGYISFTGIITYKNTEKIHEAIREVPLEKIFLETDCPYLTPDPYRKAGIKLNEPKYVKIIAGKIAEIRGISLSEVERTTTENAIKFFKLKSYDDRP